MADAPLDMTPAEKQKMDYQAKLEQEKIACCSGARWKEIFWDKFLFGLAVAGLTALAVTGVNCINDRHRQQEARELEQYKLVEARRRFFMEKRLEALANVTAAMSAVTKVYFGNVIDGKVANPEAANREYASALVSAREVLNRAEPLFDESFNTDMTRYYELHRAINRSGIEKNVVYRDFISAIETQVSTLSQAMLRGMENGQPDPVHPSLRLTLKPITYTQRVNMPPEDYVKAHYEFWKAHKK